MEERLSSGGFDVPIELDVGEMKSLDEYLDGVDSFLERYFGHCKKKIYFLKNMSFLKKCSYMSFVFQG